MNLVHVLLEREIFIEYGEASRYQVQEVVGKGSYGVVGSATDTQTGEKIAIKKINDVFEHTLGMMDYDKRLSHAFTAHPKIDPVIGEMFTLGYAQAPPYVTYRVISNDGVMNDPVPITVAESMMMHDFAITKNYAIFMDLPLYF
ncbi:carotenoid cleavage dioxygenase 1, partial [Tanacetum coccineum]